MQDIGLTDEDEQPGVRSRPETKEPVMLYVARDVYSSEGGMQRLSRRYVQALVELHADRLVGAPTVIAWSDQPGRSESIPPGVRYFPLGRPAPVGLKRFVVKGLNFLFLQYRIFTQLRGRRAGTVVFDYVSLSPLALLIKVLSPRSKVIVLIHGVEVWNRPVLSRRIFLRLVDRFLSVSEYSKAEMLQWANVPADRIVIVSCAVDVDGEAPPVFVRTGAELLTVSRLEREAPDKHIDKVIRAMPLLLRGTPSVRLTIIGGGGALNDLKELAKDLGVDRAIRFLGKVDDAQRDDAYEQATVFVLPSTREGFGIVFLEAWLRGLPIVAGNGGAAPEIVRHNKEGYCVEPEPEAIAKAVGSLLRDANDRERLARAGYQRVSTEFTHEQFVERVRKVLS